MSDSDSNSFSRRSFVTSGAAITVASSTTTCFAKAPTVESSLCRQAKALVGRDFPLVTTQGCQTVRLLEVHEQQGRDPDRPSNLERHAAVSLVFELTEDLHTTEALNLNLAELGANHCFASYIGKREIEVVFN